MANCNTETQIEMREGTVGHFPKPLGALGAVEDPTQDLLGRQSVALAERPRDHGRRLTDRGQLENKRSFQVIQLKSQTHIYHERLCDYRSNYAD